MGAGARLVDLGNRRLKTARACGPGRFEELDSFPLWSAADEPRFAEAAAWLGSRLGEGPLYVSSTHPAALRSIEPVWAGRNAVEVGSPRAPLPVRSAGTGSDRLLAGLAAWKRAGTGVVVADLGTAWTLDLVSAQGEFLGGAIGPGLGTQEAALRAAAPHLAAPAPEPGRLPPPNTAEAVATGTAGALAAALEVLARRFERTLAIPVRRFLTGGDGPRLHPWLREDWEPAEHLVLEGLAWMAAGDGAE